MTKDNTLYVVSGEQEFDLILKIVVALFDPDKMHKWPEIEFGKEMDKIHEIIQASAVRVDEAKIYDTLRLADGVPRACSTTKVWEKKFQKRLKAIISLLTKGEVER